jgi:mono/diheme cytochrome c family protein
MGLIKMHKSTTRKHGLAVFLWMAMGTGLAFAHENEHHHGMDMTGHWMAPVKAANRHNPVPATAASQARGQALFQTHCAACHGERGEGDGPVAITLTPKPANLKTMANHHSDGDQAWKIAQGRGAMPGWKSTLKPKQIWDLVNYIRRSGDY